MCALFWSSWFGWCQPGFCFHPGKACYTTRYPHCALCLSAERMELHLQGSSRGNLWLLDSPPSQHSHMDKCQTSPPLPPPPALMFLHLPINHLTPSPLCKTSLLCERPSRRPLVLGVVSDFGTWCHGPRAHFNYVHSGNICHITDVCFGKIRASTQTNKVNRWQLSDLERIG